DLLGGARGWRARVLVAPARRLRRADGEEPEHRRVRVGSDRYPGLAAAESPAPAVRQQEGAPGPALPRGPGAVAASCHRSAQVLPDVPGVLHVRQPAL